MITAVTSSLYDDYMQAKFANYEARRDDLNTLANYAKQFEQTDEFLAQLEAEHRIKPEVRESRGIGFTH